MTAARPPQDSRGAEFRAHWPALLAATVGVGLSVTGLPFFTAGVFVEPLQDAFGWSRSQIAAANLVLFWTIGLASPLVGAAIDRSGVRAIVLGSMAMMGLGFLLLSLQQGSMATYLTIAGAIGFLGSGASAVAYTRVVNARFERARGLALGVCLMGSGLVGALAPSILEAIISSAGWRWAYRALALAIVAAMPLMLLLDTRANRATAQKPVVRVPITELTHHRRLWLLLATVILTSFATMGASYHLVPLLTAMTGSAEVAARHAGLLGVSVIVARLLTGYALDRVFAPLIAAGVALLAAAGCLVLAQSMSDWAVVAVILLGAALGAEYDLMAYLTARYFRAAAYGRVYGVIFGVSVIASGLSPFVMGALYDANGDYRTGLLMAAAALVASAPVVLAMGRYPDAARVADEPRRGRLLHSPGR